MKKSTEKVAPKYGGPVIFLGLCSHCEIVAHDVEANGYEDGWNRLPAFCVVCAAKVAQAVRLLTLPDRRFAIVEKASDGARSARGSRRSRG